MKREITIYRVIGINMCYDDSLIESDDAERIAANALCDAGNSIIGDKFDGDVTIQMVSDHGDVMHI